MRKGLSIVGLVPGAICLVAAGTQAEVMKATAKSDFVGSETSLKCHNVEADSWKLTYHSKLVGKKVQHMLKDVVEEWETDGFTPGPAKGNVTGMAFSRSDVEFTIGSKWKQRYLVKNDQTGGYQFLDKQFNRMSGKWESYRQNND